MMMGIGGGYERGLIRFLVVILGLTHDTIATTYHLLHPPYPPNSYVQLTSKVKDYAMALGHSPYVT